MGDACVCVCVKGGIGEFAQNALWSQGHLNQNWWEWGNWRFLFQDTPLGWCFVSLVVCVCVCLCVNACICIYLCACEWMHVYIYLCVWMFAYVYTCVCVHTRACVRTHQLLKLVCLQIPGSPRPCPSHWIYLCLCLSFDNAHLHTGLVIRFEEHKHTGLIQRLTGLAFNKGH